jgi:hypothetical protein
MSSFLTSSDKDLSSSRGKSLGMRLRLHSFSTQTSNYPPYSRSLESWYGWVRKCCITRESCSEDIAGFEAMAYSLKHYMLIVGFNAKPLRRQRPRLFEDKGKCSRKAKALGRQRSVEGKGPWIACVSGSIQALSLTRRLALGWQSTFEHKGPWNAKALGMQRPLECKGPWKAKTLRTRRPFEGNGPSMAKALRRQRAFDGKGSSSTKAKALGRQMRLEGKCA